jgi:hypothetical protein
MTMASHLGLLNECWFTSTVIQRQSRRELSHSFGI